MSLMPLPIPRTEAPRAGRQPTVHQRVRDQLRRSNYRAVHDVSFLTSDDVVCLIGFLPSHYLKQLAEEIALAVEGVCHAVNRIEVVPTEPCGTKQPSQSCHSGLARQVFVKRVAFIEYAPQQGSLQPCWS